MNKLSEQEVKLFYKLMHGLLYYANQKFNVMKNISSKEEFFKRDIKETVPLRDKIYKNLQIFDDFANENPENFGQEELDIIVSWKKFKQGKFFLAKYTKEYAVFFDGKEKKAYGILGITDSFEDMFHGYFPTLMKIVFLPFKGKVTYEGIFMPYSIHFGGGMRKSLKLGVNEAIQQSGIITSFEKPAEEKTASDEEMLRFYMKSGDSMDRYWEKINELRTKSQELEAVYYQEWARHSAKAIKKNLKSNGVKGHFAVLDEAVVASGNSPKQLEDNINAVVPEDKRNWIYKFRL